MGAQVVDYRVSTLVVLCKDCGNDVGLYPARHKCTPIDRPAMPTLPAQYKKSNSPGTLDLNAKNLSSHSMTSSPSSSSNESPSTPKWSSSRSTPAVQENDESVYFNNFAVNLPETNEPSGKKLWGKVRQNDKWKQLSEKNEKPKPSGKLWGKLLQATQTMADKIPSRDDRGAESDEDDWEGETHVARILREYYEKKHLPLPGWLFDENMVQRKKSTTTNKGRNDQLDTLNVNNTPMRTPSRRKLWEQDPDEKKISNRERERLELRQAATTKEDRDDRYGGSDRYSQRKEQDRYHQRDDDRYHQRDEDRYRQREEDRYRQKDEERYRHREEERYQHREENRFRQRDEDRYRSKEEDRYRSKDDHRQRDKERYYQEERHRPREEDRYRSDNHYKSSYAKEEDHHRRYVDYDEDRYNPSNTRPLSPPRSQQRSNSTNRQRAYEDSSDYHQPIRSGRSIRGYKDAPRERYENHDVDDYYGSRTERRYVDPKRERSQRYVNDNNYF